MTEAEFIKMHNAKEYYGEGAKIYDKKRLRQKKWWKEATLFEDLLANEKPGTTLLDVPYGTGRFIYFYEKHAFNVIGVDLSADMLAEARAKTLSPRIICRQGDITKLELPDKSVDIAVCIRLFNWLSIEDVKKAIKELQRVAREKIIFTVRVRNHVRARSYELIKATLCDWHVARDEEIEPDFRMVMLKAGGCHPLA